MAIQALVALRSVVPDKKKGPGEPGLSMGGGLGLGGLGALGLGGSPSSGVPWSKGLGLLMSGEMLLGL